MSPINEQRQDKGLDLELSIILFGQVLYQALLQWYNYTFIIIKCSHKSEVLSE